MINLYFYFKLVTNSFRGLNCIRVWQYHPVCVSHQAIGHKHFSVTGKLNPLAFGIMKLSILCTIEDAKVSVDDLIEKIQEFEDFVQSVDVAAFNKV